MANIDFIISETRDMINDINKLREENLHLIVQRDMLLLLVAVLTGILIAL